MSQNRAVIELSVFQGDTLIARQSFDQDKIILGRISSADFRIPSPQVSRIHALLEILPDGQMKITDLASTHGTFVNGGKIVEAILRETDQIKVADVTIKLVRVTKPVGTQPGTKSPTYSAAGASSSRTLRRSSATATHACQSCYTRPRRCAGCAVRLQKG